MNNTSSSHRRRLRAVAALSATLALVAAGCGSDDNAAASADESSQAAPETTDAQPAPDPAEAADDSTDATAEEAELTEAEGADAEGDSAAEPDPAPAAGDYDRTGWPDTLTYAIVPAENAENIGGYITPNILSDELGIEFEVQEAADYAGVIEGMIAERVDVGSFGAFSYVIASGNGADIGLAGIWSGEDGPDTYGDYRSYLVVPPDSDIAGPADLAGRSVCFVDPGSTSGFLFPSAALLEVGLNPNEDSTDITPVFAGGHDASALAVKNGDCEAGFAYDTMLTDELIEQGDLAGIIDEAEDGVDDVNPESAELKIIWKSAAIAAPPLAFGNWLPESLQTAIKDITTEKINVDYAVEAGYCENTEDCELADGYFWGFIAEDDSYFDGIRDLCELTGSTKCALDG